MTPDEILDRTDRNLRWIESYLQHHEISTIVPTSDGPMMFWRLGENAVDHEDDHVSPGFTVRYR